MKVLFDQGTPVPLRQFLDEHSVDTAFEMGWSTLRNGELLDRAEQNSYELLVTTDHQLRYQQDLSSRGLAVLVLLSTSWPRMQTRVQEIQSAIGNMQTGEYRELAV